MDFFDVVQKRRSIRKFSAEKVPESIIRKALEAATLAPNSSNAQTWDFYWVRSEDKKSKVVDACLNQSAARTAGEIIVITANPKNWKRSQQELVAYAKSVKAPPTVIKYYEYAFPAMYKTGIYSIFKKVGFFVAGLFTPIMRRPASKRDVEEVCLKSATLACENFVLAITAQGYDTCMMEGFDEVRLKKALSLKCSDRIAMVIAVGKSTERGTWGPQFRISNDKVIHEVY